MEIIRSLFKIQELGGKKEKGKEIEEKKKEKKKKKLKIKCLVQSLANSQCS